MAQSIQTAAADFKQLSDMVSGYCDDCAIVHKFGRNAAVGSASFVPVSIGGIYRTPQAGSETALRVKAGNAADTAAGAGARQVTIEGLDETGALAREALATNGTSAGTAGTKTFLRVFRAWVSESGSYATQTTGSHTADIVIENSGGTEDWLTIDSTDFSRGQSEIGSYTVPLGKVGFITSMIFAVDANQASSIILFKRENILEAAAPFTAMRMQVEAGPLTGYASFQPMTPLGPYPALTDIGFMGKASAGTAEVDVDFEILLFDA